MLIIPVTDSYSGKTQAQISSEFQNTILIEEYGLLSADEILTILRAYEVSDPLFASKLQFSVVGYNSYASIVSPSSSDSNDESVGLIVGLVVGFTVLIVIVAVVLIRRR